MSSPVKGFRERSFEKFSKAPNESSEIFRKQTMFNDFEAKTDFVSFSGEKGVKIVEESSKSYVRDMKEADIEPYLRHFDIDDRFVQMNNAFFNSGIVVDVKRGENAGTLRIRSEPHNDMFSKMVIVAREGSKIEILKEAYSPGANGHLVSEDVLIVAGPGSNVTFSELQNYNASTTYMSNKIAYCGRGSRVSWNIGLFGSEKTRSRTYNFMEGQGSEVDDLQLTFADGLQKFDAFSNLVHVGRSTAARCVAKGAFKDKSNSVFKGMIKIREKAKNASSYLACHGMLLSREAKANAIPGLEIETDEVKATHSASVSPIDLEKIFYLTSRGIEENMARKMITTGFFDPLIKRIPSGEIRAKMRFLVDSKWEGASVASFDDKVIGEYMTEDAIKSGDIFEGHYKYR